MKTREILAQMATAGMSLLGAMISIVAVEKETPK